MTTSLTSPGKINDTLYFPTQAMRRVSEQGNILTSHSEDKNMPVAQFESNTCRHACLCVLYYIYSAWGTLWQLCPIELLKVRNRLVKSKTASHSYSSHTTQESFQLQSNIILSRWIGKTSCYCDLHTDSKYRGCPDITLYHLGLSGSFCFS